MSALAIARTNFTLMVRDRSNAISMVMLPLLFVFLIGSQFGGEARPVVAVARTGAASDQLARHLVAGGVVEVERVAGPDAARAEVGGGGAALGVIVPADDVVPGRPLRVELVTQPDGGGGDLRPLVTEALGEVALVPTVAADLARLPGAPPDGRITTAVQQASERVDRIRVELVGEQGDAVTLQVGRFTEGAAQQLVLMVFLFTLYSAIPMAQTRALGVTHRIVASPTPLRSIIVGEALGRWLVALAQGAYIVAMSSLLFDVTWGSIPATVLVIAAFGAVGAGAGMLLGGLFSEEGLLVALGSVIGLAVAAMGGAMVPSELFGATLQTVARWTPHAWALDALAQLRTTGSVGDILAELAVLTAMAAGLLCLATLQLRRLLHRP